MADRSFFDPETLNREVKIVAGRCTVSTNTVTVVNGIGFSFGDFSSGVVTCTLDDRYNALLHASVSAFDTDPEIGVVSAHSVTSGGTNTVTLTFLDSSGAAANPGEFSFALFLLNADES